MTDYIDMYYKPSPGDKTTKRQYVEVRRSRARYGLHYTDTWSLDHYLAIVISNSLKMLAEHSISFPGVEPFEDPDDWVSALLYHSESFKLYAERGKFETESHGDYEWPEHDWDDYFREEDGHTYWNLPEDEEEPMRLWSEKCRENEVVTKERIDESLDFLKEWWEALWD